MNHRESLLSDPFLRNAERRTRHLQRACVPRELDRQVRRRMKSAGFNPMSEYVRPAIRADLERTERSSLETEVLHAVIVARAAGL